MINRNKGGYSILPNHIFKLNLSLKAIGLYSYMNSKTTIEDWNFSYKGLMSELLEGERALKSAIKELKNAKLLMTISKRSNFGFTGHKWILNPTNDDLSESAISAPSGTAPSGTAPSETARAEIALSLITTEETITEEVITEEPTTEKIEVVKKDFTAFKLDFINKHKSKYFKIDNHPTLNEIYFSIDKNNLIKNENTNLILKTDLAFEVWKYIFNGSAVTVLCALPVHFQQKTLQVNNEINPIEIFTNIYNSTQRIDYAFLEASKNLSYKQQNELNNFKSEFEGRLMFERVTKKKGYKYA